ncbi:S8 family serine peptidase [Acidimicrobiia bacterium EGI L10123]|nr:S8 family serine peptidase [Acidimicrobiia bacterium EGI L10123]
MLTPTDTFWSNQWGPRQVSAPAAWDVTTGASSVVVAVLDTGVNPGPEFDGKLLSGIDLVNDDSDPADDNDQRHGTAVAAIAAADANDGGVAGMCWTCRILPVKVLAADGSGSSYDIAQGIAWATDRGADVVVMSLGGPSSSRAIEDAVAYARARDVVVVAAAGNAGSTTPNYPAAHAGVIGVAGSTSTDSRYSWSNHGSWVDVAAPGCNGAPIPKATSGYGDFCGTSSATPLVAGAVALGLALGATGAQVEDAVRTTAVPVGSWVAHGRIDADRMLTAVAASLATTDTDTSTDTGTGTGTGTDTGSTDTSDPESEPEPDAAPVVVRAAGADRVATSVALADRAFPDGTDRIVIGRSDAYADALAAAPLAASLGAPVVLSPSAELPPNVADLVQRLGVDEAVLVGGTGALSADVADDLRSLGISVRRIAGTNRFDTARLIAAELGGTDVYLVEGANASAARGWPDAVAVSGLAALQERPILLTTSGALPAETATALLELDTRTVTIVGGTAAVSDTVAAATSELATVRRVWGSTRYDTSTKLADLAVAAGADDGQVWLATGRSFPDALAAGAAAAHAGAVLLLVDGVDLAGSPEPLAWLGTRTALREVVLVGGTSTLSAAVETSVSSLG